MSFDIVFSNMHSYLDMHLYREPYMGPSHPLQTYPSCSGGPGLLGLGVPAIGGPNPGGPNGGHARFIGKLVEAGDDGDDGGLLPVSRPTVTIFGITSTNGG